MTTVKVAVLVCGGGVQTSVGRWRAVPSVELEGGGLGRRRQASGGGGVILGSA
jgi:hypothetical protein